MVEEKHTAHLVNLVDMGPLATKIKNYRTNFLTLKLIYFIILAQNFPLITSLMPDVLSSTADSGNPGFHVQNVVTSILQTYQ